MTILNDIFEPTLTPLLRLKPSFLLADGIFSDFERSQFNKKENIHIYTNRDSDKSFLAGFLNFYSIFPENKFTIEFTENNNTPVTPLSLINNLSTKIQHDLNYLHKENFYSFSNLPDFEYNGNPSDLYIHRNSKIGKLVSIDTTNGPVVIDENSIISSFSTITGPVYIGKNNRIDRCSISNSRSGNDCRLSGEISDTILGNFTNKHHEGFLGHSLVGDWVNLGALTTTSDLKNNYGVVYLEFQQKTYSAETIKFGSIIGDYVKTSIGTMLNTGTIIDLGALLFSPLKKLKYYPPFFWGGDEPGRYRIEKFLNDMTKIMARRNQIPSTFLKNQILLYENF